MGIFLCGGAEASPARGQEYLTSARLLFGKGQYFTSARYAFAAAQEDRSLAAEAYSWVTAGLVKAGLPHSASYFFIRTLHSNHEGARQRALRYTEDLLVHVGPDLLRDYLKRLTRPEQYDLRNMNALNYSMGKDDLLRGRVKEAVRQLSRVASSSPLYPYALQARGTAEAILGQTDAAVESFRDCVSRVGRVMERTEEAPVTEIWMQRTRAEAEDLANRCRAGVARTLYQAGRFDDADRAWDEIPKDSFVWTDILFEQAWSGFAKGEFNRALGKLVTYKSPVLEFVFNTEVEVLRAQSYLMLCQYNDANITINDFNRKYAGVGQRIKSFVERTSSLDTFYETGKDALSGKLFTRDENHRFMNRFVRSPYFQGLVKSEEMIEAERAAILRFGATTPGAAVDGRRGFPGFLGQVLNWRRFTVQQLGGAFVRNSLMDYHSVLISDFEKMAFIKLEMLSRAKSKLIGDGAASSSRGRGNVVPARRDNQFRWGFNGEFWSDELGDYVFGLESECERS